MSTWEDRMAARTRARGRHYEQFLEREQRAADDEYNRIHGTHHMHLDGSAVYCSCGEFCGVTCVAFPAEWWDMTPEQRQAEIDRLACSICGQRGVVNIKG